MTTRFALISLIVTACSADPGPSYPAWNAELAAASEMGVRRGLTPARGIVHSHSPYSHDACDGRPRDANGVIDEQCLQDLRLALCRTRMDYAAMSDHDDSMADEDWGPDLFFHRPGDELITGQNGALIASRIACINGHQPLVFVGSENAMMPIMLENHPVGDVQTRHDTYNGTDLAAADALRAQGGIIMMAHSEQQDVAFLRDIRIHGMEAYNLHAAIAPNIREQYLGLPPNDAALAALEFNVQEATGPEPDLALVSFLEPNLPSLDKWGTLLGEGMRIVGTAGSDVHQNALPFIARDGERLDSFRRVLRWFSNVLLVDDPTSPQGIKAAMTSGRLFMAFEILGTPVDFDFRADHGANLVAEMGDEITVGDSATIVLTTPTVADLSTELAVPSITAKIFRIDANGTTEVASGTGTVSVAADLPGAYRAEVWMTPLHLAPYFGSLSDKGYELRDYPWVYSNAIYVRP